MPIDRTKSGRLGARQARDLLSRVTGGKNPSKTGGVEAPIVEGKAHQEAEPTEREIEPSRTRMREVLGEVEAPAHQRRENAGTKSAHFGAALFDTVKHHLKKGIIAACFGLALFALPNTVNDAIADTAFFDHNNAVKEVVMARQLAAEVGEKFVLVRPDAVTLDAVFARAERGDIDVRHLIVSGHSSGLSFSGTGPMGESLSSDLATYQALKQKYPKAFAQVKHVHFLSCYAGSMSNSAQWRQVFENANSFGFHAIGPSKERPAATQMLANTERYARQHIDGKKLTPQQMMIHAKNLTKLPGANITNFAARVGEAYASVGETITTVDVARDRVNLLRTRGFDAYLSPAGQEARFANPPPSSQVSELSQYYRALQAYRNVLEPGSYDATQAAEHAEVALRLFHWNEVLGNMQRVHGAELAQLSAALSASGIDVQLPADFSKLTRLQVVELAGKLDALGNAQIAAIGSLHAQDLVVVNAWLQATGESAVSLPGPNDPAWQVDSLNGQMTTIAANETAPAGTRAAAQRIAETLAKPVPAELVRARELVGTGLRNLSPTVIPQAWIGR